MYVTPKIQDGAAEFYKLYHRMPKQVTLPEREYDLYVEETTAQPGESLDNSTTQPASIREFSFTGSIKVVPGNVAEMVFD